jgi:hypothetical protein
MRNKVCLYELRPMNRIYYNIESISNFMCVINHIFSTKSILLNQISKFLFKIKFNRIMFIDCFCICLPLLNIEFDQEDSFSFFLFSSAFLFDYLKNLTAKKRNRWRCQDKK